MKKLTPLLLGIGLTLVVFGAFLSSNPLNVGAASVVSLGRNGTSTYLLYPTDSLTSAVYIASSTTASSSFANGINLTGGCFAMGGTCLNTTGASSTLLGDANTWSGVNIFSNSASTFAGTAAKATILATARAINGTNFDGSAPITITAASSTLLGDINTWSNTNQFAKLTFTNATGTNATTSSFAVSNLSAGLVKALAGGSLVNAVAGVDYQAPGSYITLSSLSATAPIVYNSGTGAFSWTGLATTSQPASSNLLVSNGGSGVYGVATGTVSATLPLSVTAGRSVIGGALSVTIADAVADASTKGASTYVANDFNSTAGSISIDYTNGQAAATGAKGFLTSTDWNTFNGKESVLTFNYPLTRSANAISSALSTTTANTWSGANIFNDITRSTTTNATSTTGYFSGVLSGLQGGFTGRISPIKRVSYITATTTAWTGTTSGAYLIPIVSPFAGTIQTAQCSTDAGTLNVDVYHTTTHLTLFNASTTVGTITFSSNNTITNGEKIYVSAGTPASTPIGLTCTLSITENL